MKHLFKPENIRTFIVILSLMLIVKLGWFAAEMAILRSKGVDMNKSPVAKSLYYRTRFASQKLMQKRKIMKPKPVSDIKSFKLLALYHSPKRTVVTISKNGKSKVLVRGDQIDGYVLDDATSSEAIFLRDGKSYRLPLIEPTKNPNSKSSVKYVKPKREAPKENNEPKGEVTEGDDVTIVDRSLLDHYRKNMKDIWKNIGIMEIKKGGKIDGFKVNFVKRGSDFAKLGLRRGDIIKSINGEELNSYNAAFNIYKKIDTMENLTMKIMRGKKELELEYEIN